MQEYSPWWYRRRSSLIFTIYVVGFYGGWWIWQRATGLDYVESYAWLAARLHAPALPLLWIGAVLVVLGFLCRLWGSSYLTAAVVWSPQAYGDRLIVDGPFRFIRNPLYFGNDLQAIGIGAIATPVGFVIVVGGILIFSAVLAAYEAQLMRSTYGDVYERYRAKVPSLFPRPTPARVEGSVTGTPSVAGAICAELFTGGMALGMLGIAIFGSDIGVKILGVCCALGWLVQSRIRRPRVVVQ